MSNYQRWKGIMKCYPLEEKRLLKWEPPFIVQPKYDGVRCRAIPLENGEFMLLSSEENIIYSVPHINEDLKNHIGPWELDGELYACGLNFEEIISITSRTVNLHPDYHQISFHIFDIVNETMPQASRIKLLKTVLEGRTFLNNLEITPYWICESLEDIMKVYNHMIVEGFEGIIVRHFAAPYERKRSIWVMKFKGKKEDEYEIVGYKEEISIHGIPKDTLGALQCKSGDGNTFFVGTGFSDDMRRELWKNKELLIGKVAKVKYQHLTSGNKVPRFPVFTEVIR